ncbi:MAG: hypothetical protein ABI240_05145, partial [Sphingomonas sp.]
SGGEGGFLAGVPLRWFWVRLNQIDIIRANSIAISRRGPTVCRSLRLRLFSFTTAAKMMPGCDILSLLVAGSIGGGTGFGCEKIGGQFRPAPGTPEAAVRVALASQAGRETS